MITEIGHFALILAGALALLGSTGGLYGAWRLSKPLMSGSRLMVFGQMFFVLLAFIALLHAFLQDDFTVAYVARNSNSLLPWYYKVSALWGAHEGSFLLWTLIMTAWTTAVAATNAAYPDAFRARVLGVMSLLNLGFIAFLLFTSNPFERLLPLPPPDGADLNPLLQDFGLIVHPPMLYTGYVGFSVAFAFAIAALLGGRLDGAWARWCRPWTNVAWAFLTVGIALGSWWAYYELGWGGWWFWDPVENASFMPWLVGTALVHSLAVTEKRGVFKSWTVLLAIAAFSLSLLGAFIVRSGVLTSVHAFAVDPTRGLFILGFLVVVIGGSLLLYGLRVPVIRSRSGFGGLSRELLLLVNNLLLVLSMAVVLFGTLWPIAYEALTGGGKISVGPPYFNGIFIPLMVLLALALGLSPMVRWKNTPIKKILRSMALGGACAFALGLILPTLILLLSDAEISWSVLGALLLAGWIVGSHVVDLWARLAAGSRPPGAYWGMFIAHLGFATTIIGVSVTSIYSFEKDLRMVAGDRLAAGSLVYEFVGVKPVQGPNYVADQGHFIVTQGTAVFELFPEKRRYQANNNIMTEAAIEPGFLRDIYVSLGEALGSDETTGKSAWAVRVQHKPLVRWVWFGAMLMALGGTWALFDKRYRRLAAREKESALSSLAKLTARDTTGDIGSV